MATQESNVIMFPQRIDPERKEDVRIAEQFLEKIDGLIMKGLRRDLAAAEARVLAGDVGAAEDAEFLFLSITRRLRDRDAIRREVIEICARAGRAGFLERRTTRGHGGPPPWHKNRNRPRAHCSDRSSRPSHPSLDLSSLSRCRDFSTQVKLLEP